MTHHNVEELKDMIEFCDERINSKVLAENGECKAVLFAMKKEQCMPEHTSPRNAFIYLIEGEIEFEISHEENEKYKVKKGDIFFFNADEKHTVLAKKDTKMLVVRI